MRVLYRAEAAADLAQAWSWYEAQRPGLGDAFRRSVEMSSRIVRDLPDAFPVVERDVRRALVHRFPHAVYYRGIRPDEIEILACLHNRRSPRVWRRRT